MGTQNKAKEMRCDGLSLFYSKALFLDFLQKRNKRMVVEMHFRKGLTGAQVAKKLGVSVATFEVYKNKHPEFLEAVKKGKEPCLFPGWAASRMMSENR